MNPQFVQVLIVSSLFLLALEWAKRRFGFNTDYTRKTAHIFYFFVIIYSYFHLTVHEAMTVLLIFLAVFTVSFIYNLLSSIHIKIYRTWGEIIYIITFLLLFAFFGENNLVFMSGAFVLGILDPLSAFYKKTSKKNLAYNTLYFIACLALLLSIALFYGRCETNYIFLAALAAALADRYSEFGLDNITVPLAVVLILA